MKTAFFIFTFWIFSITGLSAQDTITPSDHIKKATTDDVYFQGDSAAQRPILRRGKHARPITEGQVLRARNKAIVLSSLGGPFLTVGLCLVPRVNDPDYLNYLGPGVLALSGGFGLSVAGIASWASYAHKCFRFKEQRVSFN